MAPSGIGREALVGGIKAARGCSQMLPHLLVVGAGNFDDPEPAHGTPTVPYYGILPVVRTYS